MRIDFQIQGLGNSDGAARFKVDGVGFIQSDVKGLGRQLVQRDPIPAKHLGRILPVDGAQGVEAVDGGQGALVLDVGEAAQRNREVKLGSRTSARGTHAITGSIAGDR